MKNYLFVLLWLIYFWIFFLVKEWYIFTEQVVQLGSLFDSEYYKYIISIFNATFAVLIAFYTLGILQKKVKKMIQLFTARSKFKYKTLVGELWVKFVQISKFIIAFYIWMQVLILPWKVEVFIDKIFHASFILVLLILITTFIKSIFYELQKKEDMTSMSKQVFPILSKFAIVFLWIVGWITIISNLWYNVNALITWAWVGWLAIALAAQKTIANIFGAISVILNKPFKIGDFVTIGTYTWTVKEIGLTYLKLISTNGNEILIPNETIITSSIENLTLRENRRVDFFIGVSYNTSLEKLKTAIKIIEDILETYKWSKDTDKIESYRVHFDNFWDFSLNINGTFFSRIDPIAQHNKLVEEINLQIKEKYEKEKIEIAFPTQNIIMKQW